MSRDVVGCVFRPNPRAGLADLARLFCNSKSAITALNSQETVHIGLPSDGKSRRINQVIHSSNELSVCLWGWDGLPIDPGLGLAWGGVGVVTPSTPGEFSRRFILIAWDARRQQLTVARDPLGLETVYFSCLGGGGIAISNRLQSLLRIPEVSTEPDRLNCAEALLQLPRTPGGTMVRAVREVPRAHVLTYSAPELTIRRYTRIVPRWSDATPEEQVAAMRARLTVSVGKCLGDARCPGVAFSGGLDSSSVLAIAAGLNDQNVTAVIHQFPGHPEAQETQYQELMLEHCHCQPSRLTPLAPLPLGELLEHTDEPECLPVSSLSTNWARHASSAGLDCVLAGVFGDHVGGMVRHPIGWLLMNRQWPSAWAALGRLPNTWPRRSASLGMGLLRLHLPQLALVTMRRQAGWICANRWLKCMSEDVRRAHDLDARVQSFWLGLSRPDVDLIAASEAYFDGASRRVGAVRRVAERASGIRIDDPFADVPLVDVSASLPFRLRWQDGMNRIALRSAVKGLLPESVRLRRSKAWLNGPHRDFYQILGRNAGQSGVATILELLEIADPPRGPGGDSGSGYWEFSAAIARSMASFIRIVLNRGATNSG